MIVKAHEPVLIVEDSQVDYEITCEAFAEVGIENPLFRCVDGDEALDFLFHQGVYACPKSPRPVIVLLDLNLPGTDGREVLEEIKKNEELRGIPVIVFTTSSDDGDVHRCYAQGANSYLQKPIDAEKFIETIHRLKKFWWETAVLPMAEGERHE